MWGASGVVWAETIKAPNPPDGTREFEGEIIEGSCEIEMESKDRLVPLPTVSAQLLSKEGDSAGQTKFSITLINCERENYERVKLLWNGLGSDSLLTNAAYYKGKGSLYVSIQLLKDDGNEMEQLGNKYIDRKKAANSGIGNSQPRFDYIAQYYSNVDGLSKVGDVEAAATFTIEYK